MGKTKIVASLLSVAAVAAFWLGIWFLLALRTGTDLLLPGPGTVLRRLFRLAGERVFWQATGHTLLRILIGYVAGVLSGTILAALTAWSRHAAALLSPLGRMVKATPVASFIILAVPRASDLAYRRSLSDETDLSPWMTTTLDFAGAAFAKHGAKRVKSDISATNAGRWM